jgi:HlyD family secretion protein
MKNAVNLDEGERPPLEILLTTEPERPFWRRRIWPVAAVLAIVALGTAALASHSGKQAVAPRYRTEPAGFGRLVVKVSATGNLQPTNKVEVGSELSGIVAEVLVDENDRVKKGQVLAKLDFSKLKDTVTKSRAAVAAAEGQLAQTQATVAETSVTLGRLRQLAKLLGGSAPSQSDLDAAEANFKRAAANEASARANVAQARANLQSDETDLGKASIRSPIDGLVLTRAVEPGQTVAAAFQAPVLFTLAEDLTKMKLQVDVDEADVGQVKDGQSATFSVDAWPGRRFVGVISRVGYGSKTKDNVVTYSAVITLSNDDLSLRPGMTGTADIVAATRENVLLVPNAALRFTPPATGLAPAGRSGGIVGKLMPHPPEPPAKPPAPATGGAPRVWILRDGQPVPVEIQTGITNGQMTEVVGGPLTAGAQVITEAASSAP